MDKWTNKHFLKSCVMFVNIGSDDEDVFRMLRFPRAWEREEDSILMSSRSQDTPVMSHENLGVQTSCTCNWISPLCSVMSQLCAICSKIGKCQRFENQRTHSWIWNLGKILIPTHDLLPVWRWTIEFTLSDKWHDRVLKYKCYFWLFASLQ